MTLVRSSNDRQAAQAHMLLTEGLPIQLCCVAGRVGMAGLVYAIRPLEEPWVLLFPNWGTGECKKPVRRNMRRNGLLRV